MDGFETLLSDDIDDWASSVALWSRSAVSQTFALGVKHLNDRDLPQRHVLSGLLAVLTRSDADFEIEACEVLLLSAATLLLTSDDRDLLIAVMNVLLRRAPEIQAGAVVAAERALTVIARGTSPDADDAQATLGRYPHFVLQQAADLAQVSTGKRNTAFEKLDFSEAIASVRLDIPGDWYKDPWGWSELDMLDTADGFKSLLRRLNSQYTAPATQLDMSKGGGGSRPAMVIDIEDRVCYEALLNTFSGDALKSLPSWVFGWRTSRVSGYALYENNGDEWKKYASWLTEMSATSQFCLKVDIAEFFASVSVRSVVERLSLAGADDSVLNRLETMIAALNRIPGRSGLPQRCHASSVLAQVALAPLDAMLAERERSGSIRVCRWMDDITVYADSEFELVLLQNDIQDLLQECGMTLNPGKTRLERSSTELVAQLLRDASAVQHDLAASAASLPESLGLYLKTLLEHPATAPRSALSFVCRRMRKFGILGGGLERAEVIESVPQAADVVARAVRDTNHWNDLQGWYVDQAEHRKSAVDWSVQAWGLMFATSEAGVVADYFSDLLQKILPTLLLPLAAIRTAQWETEALDAIRVAAELCRTPFEMRAVSLAGLRAGAERAELREWLAAFPSLSITATALDTGPPRLSPDFAEEDDW